MSFNSFLRVSRLGGFTTVVALTALLAGCQVRPLYSEKDGVGQRLGAIAFSEPSTRVGQQVRNQLVFLTSGGAGEPAKADYEVELTVTSVETNILLDQSTAAPSPGRVVVTANYTIKQTSDGKVVKTGSRAVTALLDIPAQEFAELRAIRDAENRGAREVAELVRADLAGALARLPK